MSFFRHVFFVVLLGVFIIIYFFLFDPQGDSKWLIQLIVASRSHLNLTFPLNLSVLFNLVVFFSCDIFQEHTGRNHSFTSLFLPH